MGRTVVPAAEPSNRRVAPKGGKFRTKGRKIHPAIAAFLVLSPGKKPAARLEDLTGASRSFCEKVIDGRKQPGAAMLGALIQSDIGDRVALAIAAGAEVAPAWTRRVRRQLDLAAASEQLKHAQALFEKLQREILE